MRSQICLIWLYVVKTKKKALFRIFEWISEVTDSFTPEWGQTHLNEVTFHHNYLDRYHGAVSKLQVRFLQLGTETERSNPRSKIKEPVAFWTCWKEFWADAGTWLPGSRNKDGMHRMWAERELWGRNKARWLQKTWSSGQSLGRGDGRAQHSGRPIPKACGAPTTRPHLQCAAVVQTFKQLIPSSSLSFPFPHCPTFFLLSSSFPLSLKFLSCLYPLEFSEHSVENASLLYFCKDKPWPGAVLMSHPEFYTRTRVLLMEGDYKESPHKSIHPGLAFSTTIT